MGKNINCESIQPLLYLTDDELNTDELNRLSAHLSTCSICYSIRQQVLINRQMILNNTIGMPVNPDLVPSIGSRIRMRGRRRHLLSVVRYSSSAAAVFFLILFTWEQAISVQKITELESRVHPLIQSQTTSYADRLALARSALTTKEWNYLAIGCDMNSLSSNPFEKLRLKRCIENQIRSNHSLTQSISTLNLKSWIK